MRAGKRNDPWYDRDISEVLRKGREKHPHRAIIIMHGYGFLLGLVIAIVCAVNFETMPMSVAPGFALIVLATLLFVHALVMKIREALSAKR